MFIQTEEDNLKLYTKRQLARATQARDLYENLLSPYVEYFHNIISTGGIRGCQVTIEDVTTAMKIWGPLVTKAKGNTVRRTAKADPTSIVSVPMELLQAQKKVTLSIDFFYINQKHIFLMTYSENICFKTNTHIVSRKVKDYWSFLKDIYKKYLVRGFIIMRIRADLKFATLQTLVGELPAQPTLFLVAQGEHVGPVEEKSDS
jgi:hypothetical protein